MSKITKQQIKEIKHFRSHGFTQQEIADRIGVSRQVVGYWLAKLKEEYLMREIELRNRYWEMISQ